MNQSLCGFDDTSFPHWRIISDFYSLGHYFHKEAKNMGTKKPIRDLNILALMRLQNKVKDMKEITDDEKVSLDLALIRMKRLSDW